MRPLPKNRKLGQGIKDLSISETNKKLIDLVENEVRKDSITEQSINDKYRSSLWILAYVLNKDFTTADDEDNIKLAEWISNSDYSLDRKKQFRLAIRKLHKVINRDKKLDKKVLIDSKFKEIFKTPKQETKEKQRSRPKRPRFMIETNEQADNVTNKFNNNRDKFHFSFKINTAGRDIEIDLSYWNQFFYSNGELKVRLDTAKLSGDEDDRIIPLHYALPYFHRWRQEYKERFGLTDKDLDEGNYYVFRKFNDIENKPLNHAYWLKVYNEVGKKLNLPIKFNPKLTRKFAISRWINLGIPEQLIKKMSGHSKDSSVLSHYSFHDENQCSDWLRKVEGIDKKEVIETKSPIIKCIRCKLENRSASENCEFCGFPLTETSIINFTNQQKINSDKEINSLKLQIEQMNEKMEMLWDDIHKSNIEKGFLEGRDMSYELLPVKVEKIKN